MNTFKQFQYLELLHNQIEVILEYIEGLSELRVLNRQIFDKKTIDSKLI